MQSTHRIFLSLFGVTILLIGNVHFAISDPPPIALPGTKPLRLDEPLDERMVRGINAFALREIERAAARRTQQQRDDSSIQAFQKQAEPSRQRFLANMGAVDPRETPSGFRIEASVDDLDSNSIAMAESDTCKIYSVRWPVLRDVAGEGLLLVPKDRQPIAHIIALPDTDSSPESFAGLMQDDTNHPIALNLVQLGCEVLIPRLINREDEFSGHPDVQFTNQSHREFVYRTSFQVGRHIIGYEVQKVLAAVDQFIAKSESDQPIGVMGIGDGGLLAMYSAAVDPRIDATLVCGYFDRRNDVWQEPIDRNVWGLLTEFGDAEIAALIAPRSLTIEACRIREITGPHKLRPGRRESAAPGAIRTPPIDRVRKEFELARKHYTSLQQPEKVRLVVSGDGTGPAVTDESLTAFLDGLGIGIRDFAPTKLSLRRPIPDPSARQAKQIRELVEFSQTLVRRSARVRDAHWEKADRSSVAKWLETTKPYRDEFHDKVIGKLPDPTMPLNPRTRLFVSEEAFNTYEVMLDVYPDVIAGGLLLLPNDMMPDEKRPVVVCQHGLEGTPQWTMEPHKGEFHDRGFSAELAERGFIVYAPQNPYRGRDEFRSIQRKSNPLQRSIFSYIIPQHRRTLQWLSTLPNVDPQRIGFYGISYGGKTAMRVPPLVPEYALAICSADFNEWIVKTTSVTSSTSYVFTGEYEIWEWNMAHVANYAELANLMTPRPFMVERGHRDGVAPDEWVAWEYAKVRRHYDELGIGDNTAIEFFNGPHTIHGKGTFDFLRRHLNWSR